jgi:O-antigen/teichoic acid export membrane protein
MLRNVTFTFFTRVITAVISLLLAVLLSQYLGAGGKGFQSIIITTISIILIFSNVFGGATLVYLVPRHKLMVLLIISYFWSLLMGLISYIALLMFAKISAEYCLHIALLSVLSSWFTINSNVLIGKKRIIPANLIALSQSVVQIIVILFLFLWAKQENIGSYIVSLYISYGITWIISILLLIDSKKPELKITIYDLLMVGGKMLKFGIQNQTAHLTQMLSFRLSYYVLEASNGLQAVGVFSNSTSLAESIWMVAKSASLIQYSAIANSDNKEESAKLTLTFTRLVIVFTILAAIVLLALPARFYVWLFGTGFEETKPVLWVLMPGIIIYNISILFGHYFSGTGRYSVNSKISIAGFAVSGLLYFILIPLWSVTGAGIAASISYLFTSVLFIYFFSKEYKGWAKELIPSKNDLDKIISLIKKKNLHQKPENYVQE